jgi:hypothetical protein
VPSSKVLVWSSAILICPSEIQPETESYRWVREDGSGF